MVFKSTFDMENINPYWLIIAGSLFIIMSYGYNLISKKTSIPSVLLLITTGILIQTLIKLTGNTIPDFNLILEVLGVIGLIMIVLEASLDLKLSREKKFLIWKSFGLAILSLALTAGIISVLFMFYLKADFATSLLYAIPLSIISSAIVIPSTASLDEEKKEFMIYESTFSDILGIMVFYFIIEGANAESTGEFGMHIFMNLVGTIALSFAISYLLIFTFQNIRTELKLFLLIAILILLYSVAKLMHFSSLLLILVFGMVLQNRSIFFPGKLRNLLKESSLSEISNNFRIITLESAFVVRTYFFIIFGLSISLASLVSFRVLFISLLALLIIYGSRYLVFKILKIKSVLPELFLAPRGLITILLFYAIPDTMKMEKFDPGILLFIIIASSVAMALSLVNYKRRTKLEISFPGLETRGSNSLAEDQVESNNNLEEKKNTD